MDMGVRLTLPKAGAFSENTVSKNEGSLGEMPNFGSKLGGIWRECYFWSFSERFKSRNLERKKSSKMTKMINLSMKLKQEVAACGSRMQKIWGLWVRVIEEPTFHQKKFGVFWWQQRQSAKIWGHWVTSALKIGGLWSLTSTSPP